MVISTVPFLTPEWAAALEAAGAASSALTDATAATQFTLQQEIVDEEPIRYALVFDRGAFRVAWGGVEEPDVTFLLDRKTAEQLGRGELNAQRAFVLGKLRVRGDIDRLVEAREAFLAVDDVFADVRERTSW